MDGGFQKAPPATGSLGAWFSKLGEGRENPKPLWLSWDSLCLSFKKVPESRPGLGWFLTEPRTQSPVSPIPGLQSQEPSRHRMAAPTPALVSAF